MAPAPSPATTRSSRKRASSVCSSEESSSSSSSEPTPATKKRATGTKVSDKVAKKELRMERNRVAAQASRDRKRVHQESLESKIEHLERQLAQALSGSATSSPSRGRSITPADSQHLADENETLRSKLEIERRQSAALKGRLGALEAKFLRLEGLLASPSSSTSGAPPVAHTSLPTTSPSVLLSTLPSPSLIPLPFSLALDNLPELLRVESTVPDPAASSNHGLATDAMDVLDLAKDESLVDNLSLSAREASSLPRRLSKPSPSTERPSRQCMRRLQLNANLNPSLHEILSAISIRPRLPPSPSMARPSTAPGPTGLRASTPSPQLLAATILSTLTRGSTRTPSRMMQPRPSSLLIRSRQVRSLMISSARRSRTTCFLTSSTRTRASYQPFTKRP
ncbi:BZ3500_MvSof-1268-A1-R1_Chr1-3g02073 [Microbotryum saponariae]|uniref:BZ3500_MvSof-1268-A1-R1_Chr1-3g02073 protein n=1 Tax=Microbotryum saponariae TaxID=289078 RepID=A0A2X0L8X5_9BASI|nr:BZ3500_MvSof-1268-A1-R1_Chr1-3g02073 [Microbotryum saponariae]SCZ95331.1 BZ3501_MvSof-1269-A2-R1_Chr1-3g01675 [Microbotryum saponariae]